MMPFAGRLIDWAGTRLGYAVAVALWSLAAMAHALARGALGFGLARFALGLSESANFPAAIRTVADWFPQRERALATGIFNSGANIGAILAPLAVPYLALHYGWRSAFVVTGAVGLVWVLLWWWFLREAGDHADATASAGRRPRESALRDLLSSRSAWAFILGKFLTDPAWWFYLFWLPGFLNRVYGLDLAHLGFPIIVVYQASTLGSIGGGWISGRAIEARLDAKSRARSRHADLRGGGHLGHFRGRGARQHVAGGGPGRHGDGGASGLVGESVTRWLPTCSRAAPWDRWWVWAAWAERSAACWWRPWSDTGWIGRTAPMRRCS